MRQKSCVEYDENKSKEDPLDLLARNCLRPTSFPPLHKD